MRCVHINSRRALVIIVSFLINSVKYTEMADNANHMDFTTKDNVQKNTSTQDDNFVSKSTTQKDQILPCPANYECSRLNPPCIKCKFSNNCLYGKEVNVTCEAEGVVNCEGPKQFEKTFMCRYCYQTEAWEHTCELKAGCNSISTPRSHYQTNCTVKEDVLCLGFRTFNKNIRCNWTGGYRWSTALILSVTLGGFGADRFYLGHWQEGIGKLFSFGGLGVWTLIDVILISLHYLGPADGSLYI